MRGTISQKFHQSGTATRRKRAKVNMVHWAVLNAVDIQVAQLQLSHYLDRSRVRPSNSAVTSASGRPTTLK